MAALQPGEWWSPITSSQPAQPHQTDQTQTQATPHLSDLIRSGEFWLHDGSIVLSVQDMLFKVHQTILANYSEVFADLFSLPPPLPASDGHEQETMEGCVVVKLYDRAEDFLDLLRAIYYPSHFDTLPPTSDLDTLLNFISGILRLSTKYIIPQLRKRCIALLTTRFPTTYQEYLNRSTAHNHNPTPILPISESPSTAPPSPSAPPSPLPPFPLQTSTLTTTTTPPSTPPKPPPSRSRHRPSSIIRTMALAQETNVPLILPYAAYLLARSSPRRLLSSPSPETSSPSSSASSQPPTTLSWHQKTIILIARESLRLAETSLSHSFLLAFRPSPRCLTPAFCTAARGPHAEWHVLEAGARGPNPLRRYERWERMNVCGECVAECKGGHERGREEVWERLPGWFGMGTWEGLRALQG